MSQLIRQIILITALATTVNAETFSFNIKDAISFAINNNHVIKSAGHASNAAKQNIAISGSRYLPVVSLEESFIVSNAPTQTFMMKLDEGRFTQNDFQINSLNNPSTEHDFRTSISIQQTIYDPSINPAKTISAIESQKQSVFFDSTKEDVAYAVFSHYLNLKKAKARVTAIEQALVDAKENMRLAKVRTEAGTGLKSDELRARTHMASIEQQKITAQNDVTLLEIKLADTMGLKEGDSVQITQSEDFSVVYMPMEELITQAINNRADIKQTKTELEKSEAELKLARSSKFPTVGAFATYQLNSKDTPLGSDNDSWFAGINLKWQLFDGFKRYRQYDMANSGRFATTELLENKSREIRYQVKESILRREEMGKRLDVAQHSLEDAAETVRLLSTRFQNSLATMAELLDAQTTLNQVRANLVDSENNFRLSKAAVLHSAGIFFKEILK